MDGTLPARWFGDQKPVLAVLTDAGDDLNAFYDRGEPAVLLAHLRRRDGQLGGERGCRDPRAGPRLPRRDPSGLLRCPVHRGRRAARGVRRLHGDRHRTRGPGHPRRRSSRRRPTCRANQFVESLAEALGDAIAREFGADSVDVGALRHALNTFQCVRPDLAATGCARRPAVGRGPQLRARVQPAPSTTSIRNIYTGGSRKGSTALRTASRTAGKLLVAAIRVVPAAPSTFSGVGQRMLQVDVTSNKRGERRRDQGRVRGARDDAAGPGHVVCPCRWPGGPAPGRPPELRRRLAVPPGTRIELTPVDTDLHGEIGHVSAYRPVPLDGVGLDGRPGHGPGHRACRQHPRAGARSPASWARSPRPRARPRRRRGPSRARSSPTATCAPPRVLPDGSPPHRSRRPPGCRARTSHEIRLVDGEPTLVRVGFSEPALSRQPASGSRRRPGWPKNW